MNTKDNTQYKLNDKGQFIIHNYNSSKLFSSFFPGVAGKFGIPMWTFYVNRGQCICSMGVDGKHNPIMEFLPANWAYNLVSSQGFRTFIKFPDSEYNFYEPFQNNLRDKSMVRTQRMIIEPAQLTLEEINVTLKMKFTVKYFNVPQDSYAGLIRQLEIENLGDKEIKMEVLDGLPLIIPYGIDNSGLKFIRRLVEAFVEVTNYENNAPLFKGKVKPTDTPDVVKIKKGNFYIGFTKDNSVNQIVKPVIDPVKIFGIRGDYNYPEAFINTSKSDLLEGQIHENRLPSAMGYFEKTLSPHDSIVYSSVIGHVNSQEVLNKQIPKILDKDYTVIKEKENEKIVKEITQKNFICSNELVLDNYARQNFLDNILRGGIPYTIKGQKSQSTIHLYSRKHGDLERDYNDYRLSPTNFSQGNGNFRDVNQNRRSDLFFNPQVKDNNIKHFYDLIQLDGYNPLVIKELRFSLKDESKYWKIVDSFIDKQNADILITYLKKSFTPGELMDFINDNKISVKNDIETLIGDLLEICDKSHATGYGEGYWTDHWTYNLDLIENYLAVYPENLEKLLFEEKNYSYYDNPHRMQPRSDRYVIWDANPMQLDAVIYDQEKETIINKRLADKNKVRIKHGKGEIYFTNLFMKILSVVVNKMATLDPEGVGIEMEAGKPNWYDALNGLPGLIGSSISETLEVKRHILFLLNALKAASNQNNFNIFTEMKELMDVIDKQLKAQVPAFEYWKNVNTAKETYWIQTRWGISGEENSLDNELIVQFLEACLQKLDEGIMKAWDSKSGVINTYFINQVEQYQEITLTDENGKVIKKANKKGLVCFKALKFKQIPLPLFLEGPVHYLRCHKDDPHSPLLADHIKQSGLFDKQLKMYKVNESLDDQPMEIGRARTFSPGWFENESIWLHMEYKYMLELLRAGLYDRFYEDFKKVFVPFFKPEVYGRSILENSSFIVSSANPDPSLHGNGFVARLSGATAEFIHILALMTSGSNPFIINENNELSFQLNPALPDWLFTQKTSVRELLIDGTKQEYTFPENTFSFMFLGNVLITYHNPKLKATFGKDPVKPVSWKITKSTGKTIEHAGNYITGELAEEIRDGKITKIEIELN